MVSRLKAILAWFQNKEKAQTRTFRTLCEWHVVEYCLQNLANLYKLYYWSKHGWDPELTIFPVKARQSRQVLQSHQHLLPRDCMLWYAMVVATKTVSSSQKFGMSYLRHACINNYKSVHVLFGSIEWIYGFLSCTSSSHSWPSSTCSHFVSDEASLQASKHLRCAYYHIQTYSNEMCRAQEHWLATIHQSQCSLLCNNVELTPASHACRKNLYGDVLEKALTHLKPVGCAKNASTPKCASSTGQWPPRVVAFLCDFVENVSLKESS